MTLKFHHILAGRARRPLEAKNQRLIEQIAGLGISQLPHGGNPRLRQAAGDALRRLVRPRTADSDDRNRRRWAAARQGEDRVQQDQPNGSAAKGKTWCAPSQIILRAT
jgi:hypothetical protein